MKTLSLLTAATLLLCASLWAQDAPEEAVQTTTIYTFEDINYPHDTFTQLLGINNGNQIAGYHSFNTNSGFTLDACR